MCRGGETRAQKRPSTDPAPPTSVALSPGTLSPLAGARLSPRPVRSLPAASLHR